MFGRIVEGGGFVSFIYLCGDSYYMDIYGVFTWKFV